jgi:hypothetical protein
MTGKKEITFGLAFVVAYALVFYFVHSLTYGVRDVICVATILGAIVLNVAGWLRWRGAWRDRNSARWRKVFGLFGLVANTLVMCLFWGQIFYGLLSRGSVAENEPYRAVEACLILSATALAVGLAAPRRIRMAVVLAGFTTICLIFFLIIGGAGIL